MPGDRRLYLAIERHPPHEMTREEFGTCLKKLDLCIDDKFRNKFVKLLNEEIGKHTDPPQDLLDFYLEITELPSCKGTWSTTKPWERGE